MDSNNIHRILSKNKITKPYFKGVLPYDKIKDNIKPPKNKFLNAFWILNCDNSTLPGSHWLLIFYDYFTGGWDLFDSLSLDPTIFYPYLFKHLKNINYKINKTPFQIQPFNSIFCGPHCIYFAYLRCSNINSEQIYKFFYKKNNLEYNKTIIQNGGAQKLINMAPK